MSNEDFLCVRCARHMKTCCQTSEVHATSGDVRRIAEFTGRDDFTEYRVPTDPAYRTQDDDTVWANRVFREDGSRRVLKRQTNGDCEFLGEQGCRLPLEVRPLVCRLYPFDYTDKGILADLATGCPLSLLASGQQLIDALQMNIDDARRWHRQLYDELQLEEPQPTSIGE